MKLTFLGGADEVGASCTLLEMAGRRILVDCGIRMNAREDGDTLPWLAPIEDAGGIEAIILTHAHMDHSGAMPLIHQSFPHVPVYMTAATLSLTTILLMDSLKIMQIELEREGEIPLYPQPAVEMFLGASRPFPFGITKDILDGDIQITFYPAGHIMGAAGVLLECDEGTILMGGDVSVTDQKTIPGMIVPPHKPDVVVIESTYGGRLHANRAAEESRLVDQVREVLERRGAILFPAFAVGRSQEIILILSQAMEQGRLPQAPIFVDGMVRQICNAYASYPELMAPWLRRRTERKGNPFFHTDSPAQPVYDYRKREAFAKTRPAIFVSSSGMLTGGPSPFYARHLAEDPLSFIAITGYQDEESPGRRLQEVARDGGGELKLGETRVALQCGVGTYGLSAHADTAQIVGALSALEPKEVALVHGDHGAREAMRDAALRGGLPIVHLPTIGTSLEFSGRRKRARPEAQAASEATPLVPELFDQLAEIMRARNTQPRAFTVQEILLAWGDSEGANDAEELKRVAQILQSKNSPLRQDRKRPFLYHLRGPSTAPKKKKATAAPSGPMDPFRALQTVDKHLGEDQGLFKRSSRIEEQVIELSFYFPKVAASLYAEALEQIAQETGWQVKLRPQPHQAALSQAAYDALPQGIELKKGPSLHMDEEKVVLQPLELPGLESAKAAARAFEEKTGFGLEFKGMDLSISAAPAAVEAPEAAEASQAEASQAETSQAEASQAEASQAEASAAVGEGADPYLLPQVTGAPASAALEINKAYQIIRQAFADAPHRLLKVGLKGQTIELAFLSPQIGERYEQGLERLSEVVGWPLKIRATADQHRIKEKAKALIPEAWGVRKEPGFFPDKQQVQVQLTQPPSMEQNNAICQQFYEETGFHLVLTS